MKTPKESLKKSYLIQRPRRLRQNEALRNLVRETHLHRDQFIMPYFVHSGQNGQEPIESMPGQWRWNSESLLVELEARLKKGIRSVLLFGLPEKKDKEGCEAWNEKGIIASTIRSIKRRFPELMVMTDVCLCAYTDHGHCGVVRDGVIDNDESLEHLARMALVHASAGADMVAPSDMMDGRIGYLRECLDAKGFSHIPLMSYAAKYASAFYGPFRDAAKSSPQASQEIPQDRKSYQMDSANLKEALREIRLDIEQGADIVMVKPALSYMDVIREASRAFKVPVAAYAVSGEYSMIKAAAQQGWIDERIVVMEIMTSLKRAGADLILTYHAAEIAQWL